MNDVLFIVLITSITSISMKLISMCYKSKCTKIDCFGLHVERDIVVEEEYDEQELQKRPDLNSCLGISIIRDVITDNDYDEQELQKRTELNKTNSEKL